MVEKETDSKRDEAIVSADELRVTPAVAAQQHPNAGAGDQSRFELARRWASPVLLTAAVAATGALMAIAAQGVLDPWLARLAEDVYFQGDPIRVLEQMTTRSHTGGYTRNHPLFPLLVHPATHVVRSITGSTRLEAALVSMAAAGAAWCALLFVALRAAGSRPLDASIVTIAGALTSGFLFWFAVPETFPFSSLALLLVFLVAARLSRLEAKEFWLTATGVAALGVTVTNWFAALVATFVSLRWHRAMQVALNVVAITTVLWAVERRVYPGIEFFLDKPPDNAFIYRPDLERTGRVVAAALLHSAVMPSVQLCDNPPIRWAPNAPKHYLSVQHAGIGTGGPTANVAAVCWAALLLLGAVGLRRCGRVLSMVVVLTLLSQIALHSVFGGETFLYAAHFVTITVFFAGMGTLTRYRNGVIAVFLLFGVAAGTSNFQQLRRTAEYFANAPGSLVSNGSRCQY